MTKAPQRNITELRLQELSPFIDKSAFEGLSTKSRTQKVRRYYQILEPLIKQPHTVYKTKSAANFKVAADAIGSQITGRHKAIKFLPVPTNGREGLKIRIKAGRLVIDSHTMHKEFIPFDPVKLVANPALHVKRTIEKYPDRALFQIQTGEFHMKAPFVKERVSVGVQKLMAKYKVGNVVDRTNSKGRFERRVITEKLAPEKWLKGLIYQQSKNQISDRDLIARLEAEKQAKYEKRKKDKKRKR